MFSDVFVLWSSLRRSFRQHVTRNPIFFWHDENIRKCYWAQHNLSPTLSIYTYIYIYIFWCTYVYAYIYIYKLYTYVFVCIYVVLKTMYPPCCHHNGFVATHELWLKMYGYKLLVPMNQRVLSKPRKKRIMSCHKWSTTHRRLNLTEERWA